MKNESNLSEKNTGGGFRALIMFESKKKKRERINPSLPTAIYF